MTTLLIILSITIVLFIWGRYPPELIAIFGMLALYITGILDLEAIFTGFSNPTVIMIAALFVVGESLSKTGWTAIAGRWFVRQAKGKAGRLQTIIVSGAAGLSGFVSNTGTVATLLPVTINASWKIGKLPSQFLIPLAFGANIGGLLTLTGTPPNIIANNALIEAEYEGFFFFEYALIGVPLLLIALLYLRFIAYRLLPQKQTTDKPIDFSSTVHEWIVPYGLEEGYYRMRVRATSNVVGEKLAAAAFEEKYGLIVLRVERGKTARSNNWLPLKAEYRQKNGDALPSAEMILQRNDTILVKGDSQAVNKMMLECNLALRPLKISEKEIKEGLFSLEIGIAEVIVTPRSEYLRRKLPVQSFFNGYNLQLLAASRKNRPIDLSGTEIEQGDSFLVRGKWEDIMQLEDEKRNFIVCGSTDQLSKEVTQLNYKSWIALGALVLMVVIMVFNWLPGVVAALIAACIPIIGRCLTARQAYRSISWGSVFLIAAMIPMSAALEKTGTAQLAAETLVQGLGPFGPTYLLAGVFLLTAVFSQFVNNSATAVLMAPIAIQASMQLGISPEPAMIMVVVSASTAFLTPIGTTTNVMVFSAGGYSFGDYMKVGAILLFLFLITCVILVPVIWPY